MAAQDEKQLPSPPLPRHEDETSTSDGFSVPRTPLLDAGYFLAVLLTQLMFLWMSICLPPFVSIMGSPRWFLVLNFALGASVTLFYMVRTFVRWSKARKEEVRTERPILRY
jgi:hypothetical protein